jgi:hypothetical protein
MSQPIPGVACRSVWRFTSSERGTFLFLSPENNYSPRKYLSSKGISKLWTSKPTRACQNPTLVVATNGLINQREVSLLWYLTG